MIRIVVVDDHRMFRQGILGLLSNMNDVEVIGEAGTAAEAERLVKGRKPDLIVMDIGIGSESGLKLAEKLGAEGFEQPIVFVTMNSEVSVFNRARRIKNVMAYILKLDAFDELASAIRGAKAGQRFVSPSIAAQLAWSEDLEEQSDELTSRERQVIIMVAEGLTSTEIAHRLKVSRRTVDAHRANIKAKLGLMNAADFARYAMEKRLI